MLTIMKTKMKQMVWYVVAKVGTKMRDVSSGSFTMRTVPLSLLLAPIPRSPLAALGKFLRRSSLRSREL
jgi:hypothetical protein